MNWAPKNLNNFTNTTQDFNIHGNWRFYKNLTLDYNVSIAGNLTIGAIVNSTGNNRIFHNGTGWRIIGSTAEIYVG